MTKDESKENNQYSLLSTETPIIGISLESDQVYFIVLLEDLDEELLVPVHVMWTILPALVIEFLEKCM